MKKILINNNSEIHWSKPTVLKEHIQKSTFIVQPLGAGLGDNLWHSNMPRLAKENGYQRVLVSDFYGFRDVTCKYLVWEENPYVDGYTNARVDLVSNKSRFYIDNINNSKVTIVDYINSLYGDHYKSIMSYPEIYYEPKVLNVNLPKYIFDPNYVYDARIAKGKKNSIYEYFLKKSIQIGIMKLITQYDNKVLKKDNLYSLNQKNLYSSSVEMQLESIIDCRNILDLTDLLFNCQNYYCVTTGAIVLADALGISLTIFSSNQRIMPLHSKQHKFVLI